MKNLKLLITVSIIMLMPASISTQNETIITNSAMATHEPTIQETTIATPKVIAPVQEEEKIVPVSTKSVTIPLSVPETTTVETESLTSEDFKKLFHKMRSASYYGMQQTTQFLYILMNLAGVAIKDTSENLLHSMRQFIGLEESSDNIIDGNVVVQRRFYEEEPGYSTTETPEYTYEYFPTPYGYMPEPVVEGYTTTTNPEGGGYYRR